MSLKETSLTTLARTKTYLGISNDSQDTLLEILIDGASDFIQTYCDRTFKKSDYVEVVRGSGSEALLLKSYPIIGDVSLEENTSGDASDSWNSIGSDRYFTFNDEGYLEAHDFTFAKRPRAYRATYVAGYLLQGSVVTGENIALPSDIELAVMRLVSGILNQRKAEGTSNQNLGDYSISFAKLIDDDPLMKSTLMNYRRPAL